MNVQCRPQVQLNETDLKRQWNASLPYPEWPFGAVKPKELAKWVRKNAPKKTLDDDFEEAPF